jgi:phage-related protein
LRHLHSQRPADVGHVLPIRPACIQAFVTAKLADGTSVRWLRVCQLPGELGQAVYYRDSRGTEPVDGFVQGLPPKRAAKIDDFIEEHLNGQPPEAPPPPFPITSQIEGELRELRVRFANTRYCVLYQRSENLVVLLHALEKDTGAVPQAGVELAKQRMADFKRRMDAIRRRPPRAAGKDAPPASRPI